MLYDLIVLGGGAAGFFGALSAKANLPSANVLLIEKTSQVLGKVRISGGGRCNVTHACFDPRELVKFYPRGSKELLGPFHVFQPKDTIAWFEARGVHLKTEKDGRMFPVTDSSETIIQALLQEVAKIGVELRLKTIVNSVETVDAGFELHLASGEILKTKALLLATGSAPLGHQIAAKLGHTIVPPVPSLFTFNLPESPYLDLSGLVVESAELSLADSSLKEKGPLLFTHWGFSGPVVLKLSAWGARLLAERNYNTTLYVSFLPGKSEEEVFTLLKEMKAKTATVVVGNNPLEGIPKKLWKQLLIQAEIDPEKRGVDVKTLALRTLSQLLVRSSFEIRGKTTNKEEFVTAGGVLLKEVDFKTMQSKLTPGLFFAGEVLDIDGVTGGFNFQNAWTTGWIAGRSSTLEQKRETS